MNLFLEVILNSSPIYLAFILGFIAKKKLWFGESPEKVVSGIALKISAPFLIFNVLYGLKINSENILILAISLSIFLIILLFGFLIKKILKLGNFLGNTLIIMQLGFGVGSFAYPFIQSNFTNEIFQNVVLIDLTFFLSFLTIGNFVATSIGSSKLIFKDIIIKIVKDPIIISIIGTLIINQLDIIIPDKFITSTVFFSHSFIFLASLLVGMSISSFTFKGFGKSFLFFITRLLFALLISFFITQVFNISDIQTIALLLVISCPLTAMGVIYCNENKFDSNFGAQALITSSVVSAITYPIIIVLIKMFFL